MRGTKTGGRQPGSQNKLTKTMKERVLDVLESIQEHPTANMAAWAEQNPTEFYKIASKLIPSDITAKVDTTIKTHDFSKYTSDELRELLERNTEGTQEADQG